MRLASLNIKNFRKIEELNIAIPPGLCVIVGENNSGKTAIMDALRLLLFSSRDYDTVRLNEDDFRSGTDYVPIEISCLFSDTTEEEEANFLECLVQSGDELFQIQLNFRAEFNKNTRKVNYKYWGGATEGGTLPSSFYDRIAAIYLQPLRDPETGLRPGKYSQVSRLLDSLTRPDERAAFEDIARTANENIKSLSQIKSAQADINSHMESITGKQLTQKVELLFNDPEFYKIISGLYPEIEGLPFTLNGLGYNNLIFTSMTLGTLKRSPHYLYRSIIIEEPEAHLHPQLQTLLLQHFSAVSQPDQGDADHDDADQGDTDHGGASQEEATQEVTSGRKPVQVIASSHSPILVSQAPLNSIVAVHEYDNKITTTSIYTIKMAQETKKKLERFLDTTRSELFFARKLIMVEGISEAILLPVLARMAGGNIKESAVTILNADGLNFNCFLPLFGAESLRFPVVILTDGDAKQRGDSASDTFLALQGKVKDISNVSVFNSEITFEHELARCADLLAAAIETFCSLHPQVGKKLNDEINKESDKDERADIFFKYFKQSIKSKGVFAQELAYILEVKYPTGIIDIPLYIKNALKALNIIP